MNLDIIKSVATLIISTGVGAIVTNAVKSTTPDDLKLYSKIFVVIGTVAASSAISDITADYSVKKIEEFKTDIDDARDAIKSRKN